MLSFCIGGSAHDALAVRDRTKLFRRSTSLGSTESLIEHRQSTEGSASLCSPLLIRLSIGLEDVDDLLDDLGQALRNL
jgi:cystathionine gamma-synthase